MAPSSADAVTSGSTSVAVRRSAARLGAKGRRGAKRLIEALVPSRTMVWRGPRGKGRGPGRIALTFDDGPDHLTENYLAVLRDFGARATFFVVGERCAARGDLVERIALDGHELASHGYTHRRFPSLSEHQLRDELTRTAALLPPRVGGRRPFVRPPHGALSLASVLTCARAGFTTALWSHDSGDWCTERSADVAAAFDDEAATKPGAVVLLHEGQTWTVDALPTILGKLKEAGHELVTMGDLLDG